MAEPQHPLEIQFQPSDELKAARQLLEIAETTGHKVIQMDPAGLDAYFQILEQEERKVFELQKIYGLTVFQKAEIEAELRIVKASHDHMSVNVHELEKEIAVLEEREDLHRKESAEAKERVAYLENDIDEKEDYIDGLEEDIRNLNSVD